MLARQPVISPDVFADTRVPYQAYAPTCVKSMAMFPVGVDQMPAAIGAYWSRVGTIDDDTIAILDALAKTTGTTLDALGLIVTPPALPPAPRSPPASAPRQSSTRFPLRSATARSEEHTSELQSLMRTS